MLVENLFRQNKHFESGKIYLGIYILFISGKFATTELIAKFDASL